MFQRSVNDVAVCLRCRIRSQFPPSRVPSIKPPTARKRSLHANASHKAESLAQEHRFSNRRSKPHARIEPLGINTLGKPSHVLLLQDKKTLPESRFARLIAKEEEDRQLHSPSEVLEEVDKEERYRLFGAEEVSANFDYLHALHQPGDRLFPVNWDKLRDVLEHGFTTSQLLRYIGDFTGNKNGSLEGTNFGDISPKDNQRLWKAGTSLFLELRPKIQRRTSQRIEAMKYMEGKTLLAERIMRDCWQLTIRNEIGQIDLRVAPKQIPTLLMAKTEPLKKVAESCNVKIDVTNSLSLIRITGSEDNSLQALKAVEHLLSQFRTKELEFSTSGSILESSKYRSQDADLLRVLEKEYGVLCRVTKGAKKFICYYLDGAEADAEDVCRSVCLARSLPLDNPRDLVTHFPPDQPVGKYSVTSPDFMFFPDRTGKWFRWATPLLGVDTVDGRAVRRPPASIYSKENAAPFINISNSLSRKLENAYEHSVSDNFKREVVTATIGKCLFKGASSGEKDEINFSTLKALPSRRVFIRDVPNTRRLFNTIPSIDKGTTIYRVHLLPTVPIFPPIELEMEIPHSTESQTFLVAPILKKANAVLDSRDVDMLLPTVALDIRFTKTTYYDILEGCQFSPLAPNIHPVQSTFAACMAKVQYSLPIAGPQPRMPSFCKIAIPKALVTSSKQSSEAAACSYQNSDFIEGEYVFPPLPSFKASRIARFNYKDLELNYSNPRTGPLFPKQSIELSLSIGRYDNELRPIAVWPQSSQTEQTARGTSLESLFQPLYTRACQLAFELSAKN
ncbi:hypothetical protein LOZ66_003096 [Ophidiomyces ophidiicola]|nr:hypothetical protein LOZ66_003096 [Ophidiomyces ophidiicola]